MDDIKSKDQFSHKMASKHKDFDKLLQMKNHKKTCIKTNNPHPQFYQKSTIHHHRSKSKHLNQKNNSNKNINNNSNNNFSNITNNNNNINSNNNNINIEETRKVFYELMMEFFRNNKNAIFPNMFLPEFASQINSFNQQNYVNNFLPYGPMKYPSENNEMAMANYDHNYNTENVYNINSNNKRKNKSSQETVNYANNCNPKNIHNISSNSKRKKISGKETLNKKSIIQNSQNVNNNIDSVNTVNSTNSVNDRKNSCNDSTVSSFVKTLDKKENKYVQLRIEIAKIFDRLTDDEMIEVLVYIENIRPQSIKILPNNTIYIDMEVFSEEAFDKVFNYVKKMIN